MINFIRSAFLLLLFFFHAASADVNCFSDTKYHRVSIDNVYVPSSARPGSILATESQSISVRCEGSGNYQQVAGASNINWRSSGLKASVDGLECAVIDEGTSLSDSGLGIVWTNFNSASGAWTCMTSVFNGTGAPAQLRRGLAPNATTTLIDKIYVVRTNKPLGLGRSSEVSQIIDIDEADSDRLSRGNLYQLIFSGSVYVAAGGCSFSSRTDVDMGNFSSATFKGAGSVATKVPFDIVLTDCTGGATTVGIGLDPSYGFADEANGVIALSSDADTAQGIGIQLLINGKAIDGSAEEYEYPLTPGTTIIPFIARYYQTAATITPGRADSTVLFYLYYE